jgi:hypothetical protein
LLPGISNEPGLGPAGLKVSAVLGQISATSSNLTSISRTLSAGPIPDTSIGETRDLYLMVTMSNDQPNLVRINGTDVTTSGLITVAGTGPRHRWTRIRENSGLTCDVTLSFPGTQFYLGMAVFAVYNLQNPTTPTIYQASGTSSSSTSVTSKQNGAIIGAVSFSVGSGSRSSTWSGLTEVWDQMTQSGDNGYTGALKDTEFAETFNVTWTPSAAVSTSGMVLLALD